MTLLAFLFLAWGFDVLNNLGAVRQGLAERDAHAVLHAEQALHLAPEHALNAALTAHHTLSEIVAFYYENAHAAVTFTLLFWLWWRRRELLHRLLAPLVFVNVAGLAVFWTRPVAPPRMLDPARYSDLVAAIHHVPVWHAGWIAAQSNQLAALPSLHIAWALWCSIAIWRVTAHRAVRAAACAYPVVTSYAVMATGNHFLADCLAGAAAMAALVAVADAFYRWRARRRAAALTTNVADALDGGEDSVVAVTV